MRVQVNGTSLYVDVEGASLEPDGYTMREKPTVLLLHGGPGHDHSIFKPAYSQLADVAQLIYVDQRGNGRSRESDTSTWNLDQWGDDVRALCDTLGIVDPIVLGWSWGGVVAMNYATRHPGHAAKLILQSTVARWDLDRIVEGFRAEAGDEAAMAAKAFLAEGKPWTFVDFGRVCAPAYCPAPPAESDVQVMSRIVPNPELTMSFMSTARFDLTPALASVQCPALVAAGTRDPITPLSAAQEIADCLPGARLEVFEQSGHFIPDTEGERFFALVRSFIAGS
ncbi:alpha/beta hydrolase [Nonomuraea sp. NPDC050404]|uniref:alpha/beta fold hydrolase n=1 Tax=Nonomuraea sp. NPDC050404 TaxID=3155783 RepID=UPI0034017D11